jgi:TrmH family RNA methyltransferase
MSYERNFTLVESAQNQRFKIAIKQLGSNPILRKSGFAAAEGLHLAKILLSLPSVNIESVWIPQSLLNKPEWLAISAHSDVFNHSEVNCMVLNDALYSKLSKLKTPTGPLIFFEPVNANRSVDLITEIVLLDGVQDPGNVGTLLRNCVAAGVQQVALSDHSAWVWSDKVLRSGMGAQFNLQLHSEQALLLAMAAHKKEVPVRVTSLNAKSEDLFNTDLKAAGIWVFGSEGQGVSQPWLNRASQSIRIPQSEQIESLNVASTSAVCLFEQVRQRHYSQ